MNTEGSNPQQFIPLILPFLMYVATSTSQTNKQKNLSTYPTVRKQILNLCLLSYLSTKRASWEKTKLGKTLIIF